MWKKAGQCRVSGLKEFQSGAFGSRGVLFERHADANQRGVTASFGQGIDYEVYTP